MRSGRKKPLRFELAPVLMLAALMLPAGCSDKNGGQPKIKKKQGIAKKIDVANRVVSMVTVDKKGNTMEVNGTFRDDTEVIINGRNMTINDIRPEDKVEVHGYREGDDPATFKWVAKKVIVTRPESDDWKTPGKPAGTPAPTTQPAGN